MGRVEAILAAVKDHAAKTLVAEAREATGANLILGGVDRGQAMHRSPALKVSDQLPAGARTILAASLQDQGGVKAGAGALVGLFGLGGVARGDAKVRVTVNNHAPLRFQ